MRESDVPQVQSIERRSFTTLWAATTYLRELRSPEQCRYVVVRASRSQPHHFAPEPPRRNWLATLLPSLFGAPLPPSPYPVVAYGGVWLTVDEGHITMLASAPEVRGRGIGELALNGLIDAALELGATALTLEVRVSNEVAQALYRKYGFEARGTRRRYYTDNNEDALIMWTDSIVAPAYKTRLRELRTVLAARLQAQAEELSPAQP